MVSLVHWVMDGSEVEVEGAKGRISRCEFQELPCTTAVESTSSYF